MFASIDRVDAMTAGKNGGPRCVQTDHRDADEITASRELSTVFALLRVLDPRRTITPEPEVTYYVPTTPPAFLVEAVAAAGGRVFVGEDPSRWVDVTISAGGARPRPVELIVNEATSALARRTAAEAGLTLDGAGLGVYEQRQLPDEEIELVDDDGNVIELDDEEEEVDEDGRDADGGVARWTKIVTLAVYAGEILRVQTKGRWVVDLESDRGFPLLFECQAGDKTFALNLLGKAQKFTQEGMQDSVLHLVSTAIAMVRAG